jgi:hypothetical protein
VREGNSGVKDTKREGKVREKSTCNSASLVQPIGPNLDNDQKTQWQYYFEDYLLDPLHPNAVL